MLRSLWSLAWPTALGLGCIGSVDLVDLWVVGRHDPAGVAALALALPVGLLLAALGAGLGNALSARVAAALGADDRAGADRRLRAGLGLGAVLGLGVGLAGAAAVPATFRLLGGTAPTAAPFAAYLGPWWAGAPALVVALAGAGGLRGRGDTASAARAMLAAALANGLLSPALVGGLPALGLPALGTAGAGLSTAVARWIALALVLRALGRAGLLGRPHTGATKLRNTLTEAIVIGRHALPLVAAKAVAPATLAAIGALVARSGPGATEAFGVALRVETLLLVPLVALSSALSPVVGQTAGAGDAPRLAHTWARVRQLCFGWGLACALVVGLAGPAALAALGLAPALASAVWLQLLVLSLGWGAQGLASAATATLVALGRPTTGAALGLVRGLGLAVPLAAGLWWALGAAGPPLALPLAAVVVARLADPLVRRHAQRAGRSQPSRPRARRRVSASTARW